MTAPTDIPTPSIVADAGPPVAPATDPGEQAPPVAAPTEPAAGVTPDPTPPAVEPDPEESVDLAAILPAVENLTVAGKPCRVRRIKLRELMLLAQVVGAALGQGITRIDFADLNEAKLFALAVVALPDADVELRNFLRQVVEPRDRADTDVVAQSMDNPEIEDSLNVLGVLVQQEREELTRLGKQLQTMVQGLQALWRTNKRGT